MEWISVKDRLPGEDVPVLLADDDSVYDAVFRYTWSFSVYYWDRDDSDGNGNVSFYDSQYWMPLPDPPKDKS